MKVTIRDVVEALDDLGLSGHPLCVHSSLRSFGLVKGGVSTIVDGLLSEDCTTLVPTFSWTFAIPPPPNMRPKRNGSNYDKFEGSTLGIGRVYTPDTTEIDKEMGAIAARIVAMRQRIRGNHPLCSFTAIGPLAYELISGQEPLNAYAPLKELVKRNGSVILMGVGLESMTLIHLAEQIAGRNLFLRWANDREEKPIYVEVGGCSDGFSNLEPNLSPLMRKTQVGQSVWRVFSAKDAVEIVKKAIMKDPRLTHCDNPKCDRCNDAVLGGPIITDICREQ